MDDSQVVQEIKDELIKKLQAQFGYCGVAESSTSIMINSGAGNIVINT